MKGADCIISNAVDLTFEEELRETADILEEHNIPYARNMATTGSLLTSNWGLTPYELVSEIRVQACALAVPGAKWVMTHPNGSHIEGYVVKPEDMDDYAHYRDIGVYRPFPEGVWSSIRARDAEGVGIINEIGVIWARHIGVPCPFKQPVKVFIEKGQIKKFEGGAEAETLTRFYQFISKYLGDAAYEVRGFHGGVHPSAILEPHQCPNAPYRHFIEHHHWSSFHFHMGNSRRSKTFPYLMHISAELRGGDLKIGDKYVYQGWPNHHGGSSEGAGYRREVQRSAGAGAGEVVADAEIRFVQSSRFKGSRFVRIHREIDNGKQVSFVFS